MRKASLVGLLAALALLAGGTSAEALARQDVSIPMDDGVSIAATLHLPSGAPPDGGWPALVLLHGLPGDRAQMNGLVALTGLPAQGYAVLTFDARGIGSSGGLVSAGGPRDVADVRALHAWLGARADVDAARIGALGISYGGGIALNSLVAGVPWRAVFAAQTWTDLASALAPQGLVKTGALASYLAAIPPERRDPSLTEAAAAALAGNAAAVRQWAAERSSLQGLASVQTPVFLAQGRRDFLFDLEQGTQAFSRLQGAKVLYLGLHGHAPSTFPAADTGTLLQLGSAWLGCHLGRGPCDATTASVYLAPESFAGQVVRRGTLPPTSPRTFALPGVSTFAQRGRSVRRTAPLRGALEVFGTPTATTTVAASGGWSRLVAVLTARTPQGREVVVGSGGVPTRPGARRVTIRLSSQATFLPQGSRLTLTLASSSTAQASANTLYLDSPMPATARVRVGNAVLRLPTLRTPITR